MKYEKIIKANYDRVGKKALARLCLDRGITVRELCDATEQSRSLFENWSKNEKRTKMLNLLIKAVARDKFNEH